MKNRLKHLTVALVLIFALVLSYSLTARLSKEDTVFSFIVTTDMRQYAGPKYHSSQYFQGTCEAIREVGKGTTFTVQLPFKTERKQKKILIADDEAYIRELFMTFFEEMGLEVFTATNGKEALDNYEKIQPDIVLSDINMPVMTGFELAKEIKLKKPEQRIVLMTGFYYECHGALESVPSVDTSKCTTQFRVKIQLFFMHYEHTVKEQLKKANIPFFTIPADLKDVWKRVSEELKKSAAP